LIRFVALGLLVAACQSNVNTPFPPGLEPLEDNPVPTQQGGARTETLVTQAMDSDYIHVYGRGYVLAPPAAVWLAAKTPQVMVARCSTDSQTITANDDPSYEFSFTVHYVVHEVITVEWNDQWRYGTVEGTPEDPMLAMMRHQKTDGSDLITLSEGTVEVNETDDPNVTELAFVEHLNASGGGDSDVIKGVQNNYNAMVASSHGNPIPACQ
jgi:hypothetical protein